MHQTHLPPSHTLSSLNGVTPSERCRPTASLLGWSLNLHRVLAVIQGHTQALTGGGKSILLAVSNQSQRSITHNRKSSTETCPYRTILVESSHVLHTPISKSHLTSYQVLADNQGPGCSSSITHLTHAIWTHSLDPHQFTISYLYVSQLGCLQISMARSQHPNTHRNLRAAFPPSPSYTPVSRMHPSATPKLAACATHCLSGVGRQPGLVCSSIIPHPTHAL